MVRTDGMIDRIIDRSLVARAIKRSRVVALLGPRQCGVGAARQERHWLRGGFPRSFIARSETDSLAWRGILRSPPNRLSIQGTSPLSGSDQTSDAFARHER